MLVLGKERIPTSIDAVVDGLGYWPFSSPPESKIAGTFDRPDVKGGMSRVSCIIF